jgi:hypothetical protein
MSTFKKAFYHPLVFFLLLFSSLSLHAVLPTGDDNRRTFDNVLINGSNSINIRGNILLIGNQLLCQNVSDGATCTAPTVGVNNNGINQHKVRIDTSAGSPTNNSWAKLSLEDGSGTLTEADEIIFARLYWSARIDQATVTAAERDAARHIQIKGPSSTSYSTLVSDDDDMNWFKSSSQFDYSTSVDVTNYVKTNRAGNYYVGDIQATNGTNKFASWALIVVVQNTQRDFNNIALYDGFQAVHGENAAYPNSVTVAASGFITPTDDSIDFRASLFVYTGESEANLDDSAEIQDSSGNWHNLTDGYNNPNDVFNASIYTPENGFRSSIAGEADPNHQNVVGTDIDKLEINKKDDSTKQFLSNSQTSTNIRISSSTTDADRYTLNMFAFETELYIPKFCYDYSYKQQGKYFTEKNDGTKNPRLVGNVIEDPIGDLNTSVDVTIFLRNLVDSDIEVSDMNVSILDMNTTQVKYKRETTSLAMIPNIIPVKIPDSTLDVADSYVKNINIGTMTSNDYFYTYYSLNPQQSDLNMSINVEVTYNLKIDGTTIPYTLNLGANTDMCSSTNFNYAPVKGMFNIVHDNYYPHTNGNSYYNLPTQVTSREGNFKVIVMDPDNLDTLKALPKKTKVAVELIDISAFHDTFTSCKELESAISPRILIEVDANVSSSPFNQNTLITASNKFNLIESEGGPVSELPNSYDFYKVANENTAFRVSYFSDENGTELLTYEKNADGVLITNFTTVVQTIGTCSQEVYWTKEHGSGVHSATQVATACGNSGTEITEEQFDACLECIYGYNTKLVCSRDNFSLRPEAFLMHLDDQNQTDPTNVATPPSRLTTNFSGIAGATTSILNLAADYNYVIDVNATNHLNNISSPGYTKSFNSSNLNDKSEYTWEPRGLTVAELADRNLACNDDVNKSFDMRFLDGVVDINTFVNQVGEYRLNILDTTWTTVDSDTTFMSHHANSFFYPGNGSIGLDCIANSSTTQAVNSATNNGCDIKSNHLGSASNLKYNDYDVTIHPYKFSITSGITMGLTNRDVNTTDDFSNFVYMTNINVANDVNTSLQVNSVIIPQGYDDSSLSNFVTECYAKPLDINISKSAPINTQLDYIYVLSDRNTTGTVSGLISNVINEDASLTTPNTFFAKAMNGVLNSIMHLNFDRDQNVVANPEDINYSKVTVYDPNTFINADLLTNKTAESNISIMDSNGSIGQNITHYFGRTAARKTRVVCNGFPCLSGANGEPNVFIYYEAYCYGDTNGNSCERTLLPQLGGRYIQKVDSRWYVNLNHSESGDGDLTATSEMIATPLVTVPNITIQNNYTINSVHSYNGNDGLPYEGNMQSTVSNWLVYDEKDVTATTNKHLIIYQAETTWTGRHETNTTTQTERVRRVNRRTMW